MKKKWYKKRKDPVALYIAKQCGIEADFNSLGDVVHEDDLEVVRTTILGVSKDTIKQLFEVTTLKKAKDNGLE